ncbi:zinc finger MYND domain-containing protein 12-like, partial [Argonauta hians]
MSIYPFALPKGTKFLCELCQRTATVVCTDCKVTYYCGPSHQNSDRESIHTLLCSKLEAVRQPEIPLFSEEQRQKQEDEMRQLNVEIIQTAATRARHLLFKGQHGLAVPAALHSARFSQKIFGPSSMELIPSYLCLGEACIGLGKLSEAERYLSQADWIAVSNPKCPSSILYNLHRNLGLLYAAKGDYDEAARHFADDVTKVWHQHLLDLASDSLKDLSNPRRLSIIHQSSEGKPKLNETDEAEGIQVLSTIFDIWESSHKKHHKDLAETSLALAMLYYILKHYDKVTH